MTTEATIFWKTTAGVEHNIKTMVTPYIKNCIALVERELTEASVTDVDGKNAVLKELKAELATREDA